MTTHDGSQYLTAATPGQFDERAVGELAAAPGWGEHTADVLREWGLDARDIAELEAQCIVVQARDST